MEHSTLPSSTIRVRCAGIHCPINGEYYTGNAVIVTASARVAFGIVYEPQLSQPKYHAMRNINYQVKIILIHNRGLI